MSQSSRTAEIRRRARAQDGSAEPLLAALLRDLFGIDAREIRINRDQYSLNSLNGFFETPDGAFFFKFHQEDGEEAMTGEYYRADILARAGLPVDQPVLMSVLPGEQILVYRLRRDRRFSDVLRSLDLEDDVTLRARAVRAEEELSRRLMDVYRASLHEIIPAQAAAEPLHRLFHERLVDLPAGTYPGGRLKSFYAGQVFSFPGVTLGWEAFSALRFRINGVAYRESVGELFDAAHDVLRPGALAGAGGVTAHGDAHNANVWFSEQGEGASLILFDPAFAGEHVPALLAEVKPTFHNIFAHPLWLYEPEAAARHFRVEAEVRSGMIEVSTSWELSPVRQQLLDVKAKCVWRPLLQELAARGLLPRNWRRIVRLGLFLCPTLVMNLRAGAALHNPASSLLGFSIAVMAASEPVGGDDAMTRFLDSIAPDPSAD